MLPEPERNNTRLIIGGLILIVIIAAGIYIYSSPPAEEEENPWVSEDDWVLSPNATAIIVQPESCPECMGATMLLEILKQNADELGTTITDVEIVYDTSSEGRNLIVKYDILKTPALILRKEGQWDSRMLSTWFSEGGTVEDDSSLVLREPFPPYYDTTTDSVTGEVEFIYLTDSTCEECYNASAFANDLVMIFRMHVGEENEYDVSSVEGNALIEKYNITLVPTFIISDGASVYEGFEDFWFTHENTQDDGWYVFRDVTYLGVVYKDLSAGE